MKREFTKIVSLLLLVLFSSPVFSEEPPTEPPVQPGNPFGNIGGGAVPNGAGGGAAFPEVDEFDQSAPTNNPTHPSNDPGSPILGGGNTVPQPPAQRPPMPMNPGSRRTGQANPPTPPAATSSKAAEINKTPTKSAPKLADYLELDASVKGLEVKNFDLPDKDIKDVVTLISKWTGKNFIIDNKVRGKITIIGPSQVSLREAYNAFLSALEANGLTTVQSGKFIRIIESAEARRAPVKTYAGDYAPKDDQFITRIFQLKYINSDEVQREFRDLTTRQGKLFAYEPTNSIIITDTGSNIQRIREILEVLDVKSFETTLHVLRIKNGSSKTISDMLSEIYGDDKKGGAGAARSFRRSALERTRGGGVISKIIPDEQTNSLIVLANQAGFISLQQLVGKLDVKVTDTGRIHVYYCEYAKSEDLAATLASLSGGGGGNSRSSSRKTNVSSPSAIGGGGAIPPPGSSGPVTAELDGGVKITSDAPTNSLVITANASDYKTIKRVIKKLDIPRLQVFVETAIMEINLDNSDKLGVNTALGAPVTGYGGGFIGDSDTLTTFLSQSGLPSGATIPIFAGPSFQANVAGKAVSVSSFMGLLNLLKTTTDSSILSTPQIIALDNEKAEFKVQDEIPVIGSSIAATATSGATQNITTLKTGIEVKLTPHVNAASRSIRLEIEQTVDSLRGNSDVPEALAKTNKAKTSRVTNTSVVVKDQDFVMMGGLISDSVDEIVTKVPLLGDIPILGWLFKSKTVAVKKKNLVILLHPQIIGTTLASANLIEERLKARDELLNSKGKQETHKAAVDGFKKKLKEQKERGLKERAFDYRNNGEEDDEPSKEIPAEVSELTPKPTKQSKAPKSEESAPLLPQSPDTEPKQEETL